MKHYANNGTTDHIQNLNYCVPDNPMPENRDQMGQHWVHTKTEIEGSTLLRNGKVHINYVCLSCGHRFAKESSIGR